MSPNEPFECALNKQVIKVIGMLGAKKNIPSSSHLAMTNINISIYGIFWHLTQLKKR